MVHAEKCMERILYLDGTPNMSDYFKINIGATVEQQFKNDLQLEYDAVKRLNDGIKLCAPPATTARASWPKRSSSTKSTTSTGSKPNCTPSARWASRTTWRSN